jgi:tol-pal system protein YbgF
MVNKNAIKQILEIMRTSMKQAFLYSLILLGLSTMLVQCVATQKDMEYTNVQVRKVDSRVEGIDKEIAELKKQTVKEVQERQAETGDRLDYHQSEILRLQGEIEENHFFIQQMNEENKELKKLLLSRIKTSEENSSEEINKLKGRLALTEDQLLKANDRLIFAENEIKAIKDARSQEAAKQAMEAAQRVREAERKARLAAEKEAAKREAAKREKSSRGPREILPDPYKIDVSNQNITEGTTEEKEEGKTVSKPVKKTTTPPVATPPPAVTPPPAATATSYDRGMTLFKQKKYRDAYNSFAEYLDKNPTGPQAVNARYYAAQSLYDDKDFELAILEFQKIIVEHPQDSLAPKALYKQGLSFEKIGDPETARIVYNKLVDTYPGSAEVSSAKTRIDALKK